MASVPGPVNKRSDFLRASGRCVVVCLACMIAALASGLLLGLSCGMAPGPLLALVLAQSLRHGAREGCKIALTPLLTDAPMILLTLLLAAKLAELRPLLGMVSIAGGAFVLYLAWENFRPGSLASGAPGRMATASGDVGGLGPLPGLRTAIPERSR